MVDGATRLVAKLKLPPGAKVLLVADRQLVAGDWAYVMVRDRLDAFVAALAGASASLGASLAGAGAAVGEAPAGTHESLAAAGTALTSASALIGGVADVVGWLRSDYSITARDVTIGTTPVAAAVAGTLLEQGHEVSLDGFATIGQSQVGDDFRGALEARDTLELLVAQAGSVVVEPAKREADERRTALAAISAAIAATLQAGNAIEELVARETSLRQEIRGLDLASASAAALVADATALLKRFDAFTAEVTAAPDGGPGYPPLLAAAIGERLHGEAPRHGYVLFAAVEASGGETITKRWLFGRPQVRYVGGARLSYLLLDVARNVLSGADSLPLLAHVKFRLSDGAAGCRPARRPAPAGAPEAVVTP